MQAISFVKAGLILALYSSVKSACKQKDSAPPEGCAPQPCRARSELPPKALPRVPLLPCPGSAQRRTLCPATLRTR